MTAFEKWFEGFHGCDVTPCHHEKWAHAAWNAALRVLSARASRVDTCGRVCDHVEASGCVRVLARSLMANPEER